MKYLLISLLALAFTSSEPIYVTIMVNDGYARFAYSSKNNGRLSFDVEKQGDYYQAPPFAIQIKRSGKIVFWDARTDTKHIARTILNVEHRDQAVFETIEADDAQTLIWLIREVDRWRTLHEEGVRPYQCLYRDHAMIALQRIGEQGIQYVPGNFTQNDLGDLVWIDRDNEAHHIPIFRDSVVSWQMPPGLVEDPETGLPYPLHFPSESGYSIHGFGEAQPELYLPADGRPRPDSLWYSRTNFAEDVPQGWYVRDTTHHSVAGEVRYVLH